MSMHPVFSKEDRPGESRAWPLMIIAIVGPAAAAMTSISWAVFLYLIERERYLRQVALANRIVETRG